jgi:hypothetical protein
LNKFVVLGTFNNVKGNAAISIVLSVTSKELVDEAIDASLKYLDVLG